MSDYVLKEKAIRTIVASAVKSYANGFCTRHLAEVDNENGVINMKIHNVFIAALGPEIQYYSALARSLDSSLGNMIEGMAIDIAALNYEVKQHVEGVLYKEQTDFIAELLEQYKRHEDRKHQNGGAWYCNPDFWNHICQSENGYDIVIDEFQKSMEKLRNSTTYNITFQNEQKAIDFCFLTRRFQLKVFISGKWKYLFRSSLLEEQKDIIEFLKREASQIYFENNQQTYQYNITDFDICLQEGYLEHKEKNISIHLFDEGKESYVYRTNLRGKITDYKELKNLLII